MSYTGCTHADWLTGGWTDCYTSNITQPSIPIQNTPSKTKEPTYVIDTNTQFTTVKKPYKAYTLTTPCLDN